MLLTDSTVLSRACSWSFSRRSWAASAAAPPPQPPPARLPTGLRAGAASSGTSWKLSFVSPHSPKRPALVENVHFAFACAIAGAGDAASETSFGDPDSSSCHTTLAVVPDCRQQAGLVFVHLSLPAAPRRRTAGMPATRRPLPHRPPRAPAPAQSQPARPPDCARSPAAVVGLHVRSPLAVRSRPTATVSRVAPQKR